ncbi:MAG: hypothetical protein JXL84_14830 [Deltaproteobacteria bacterium]|nr:hypothetical protein [Deltaproteobacteria bacterium]
MDDTNKSHREEEQRFWDAYRGYAEENRVPPERSGFYVKWVKEFTGFLPGKRLNQRSGKDIQALLADLAGRDGIADWQRDLGSPWGARQKLEDRSVLGGHDNPLRLWALFR